VPPAANAKAKPMGPFTSYARDGFRVSFIGDTHPQFNGNVVTAIASAMQFYPKIIKTIERLPARQQDYAQFKQELTELFSATVVSVHRCHKNVIALHIKAPMAVRRFKPGQFFRLQTFETHSLLIKGTRLQTETIPMLGIEPNIEAGTITLLVWEEGVSRRLCGLLKTGDPVVLMGPTGVRSKIPHDHQTVLIIGEGYMTAYLRAMGPPLRAAGNRVIAVVGLKDSSELFEREKLEEASDVLIFATEIGEPIKAHRHGDFSYSGPAIEALIAYAEQDSPMIPLSEVKRVSVMGSTSLLREFQLARRTRLKEFLHTHKVFASVNSTMQCMLKGVCAQCLQWQIDPMSGQRTKAVFACSWQDQPIEVIDLDNLDERQCQNRVHDILNDLWLDEVLA